jgi:hypothetical protein
MLANHFIHPLFLGLDSRAISSSAHAANDPRIKPEDKPVFCNVD